jgi:hypothetical protein
MCICTYFYTCVCMCVCVCLYVCMCICRIYIMYVNYRSIFVRNSINYMLRIIPLTPPPQFLPTSLRTIYSTPPVHTAHIDICTLCDFAANQTFYIMWRNSALPMRLTPTITNFNQAKWQRRAFEKNENFTKTCHTISIFMLTGQYYPLI